MELSRVTAEGQATIPKRIRDAAHIREGDLLAFDFENDRVVVRRVEPSTDEEMTALENTLSEWNSPADEKAWRDL